MYTAVIQLFHRLFYHLEHIGILNPLDSKHLFALHYVFIPRINSALSDFIAAWNKHQVSGCQGQSPIQLYTRGMMELQQQNLLAFDFFEPVTDNYGVGDEDLVPEDEATFVSVEPIDINLDADDTQLLQNTINPLCPSTNHGIDLFEQTLTAVESMLAHTLFC